MKLNWQSALLPDLAVYQSRFRSSMTGEILTSSNPQTAQALSSTLLQHRLYQLQTLRVDNGITQEYEGIHLRHRQALVMQTLSPQLQRHSSFPRWQEQFLHIAHRLRQCVHPSLPKVIDIVQENQQPYVIYEGDSGISLPHLVQGKPQGLSPKEIIHYLRQIAEALKTLHYQGLVHQNVQPHNIFVNLQTQRAWLSNFSFYAYLHPAPQPRPSGLLADGYAAWEQYQSALALTSATDIYGISATFFYLLTGRKPLSAPQRHHLPWQNWQELSPKFPESIRYALLKGLMITPKQRCQTIHDWFTLMTLSHSQSLASMKTKPQPQSQSQSQSQSVSTPEATSVQFSPLTVAQASSPSSATLPSFSVYGDRVFNESDPLKQASLTPVSPSALSSSHFSQPSLPLTSTVSPTGLPTCTPTPQTQPQSQAQRPIQASAPVNHHRRELKNLFKFILITGTIAASGGFGFAFSLMLNRPDASGSTILQTEQSFPPRQDWPIVNPTTVN